VSPRRSRPIASITDEALIPCLQRAIQCRQLLRYHHGEVFSLNSGLALNGSNAIIDFYRPFLSALDETVDIEFLVMGDKPAAAEIADEFDARKDYRPLRPHSRHRYHDQPAEHS
jgi:hypothetical protein